MGIRTPKYRPRRLNMYVPASAYSADVVHEGPHDVMFGPVAVASATNILSGQSIATAGSTTTFLQDNTDPIQTTDTVRFPYGPGFGRCLQVVASGAATSTVTFRGKDYIGQPMVETLTLNGTTPVVGRKAFKYIDNIAWSGTAATTINVGTTDKLGLPYRMENILAEHTAGARVATLGTFVSPDYTDPGTATTLDPRGTYDPQTTLDGATDLSAVFIPNVRTNTTGNGGLLGIQHFYA